MSQARSFLRKNGVYFSKDDDSVYQAKMAVAEKDWTKTASPLS
jgi:hypothetical protein